MFRLEFTEEDLKQLRYERFNHPHPRVQQRMEGVLLKSFDLPHQQIAAILGVDEDAVRRYLRMYEEGGIEGLKAINWHQPQSALAAHQDTLKEEFSRQPPATVAEAGERIASLTGIRRKPTQVRKFLKRLGMAPRKVAAVPSKADPDKQADFKKNALNQGLRKPSPVSALFSSLTRLISS